MWECRTGAAAPDPGWACLLVWEEGPAPGYLSAAWLRVAAALQPEGAVEAAAGVRRALS